MPETGAGIYDPTEDPRRPNQPAPPPAGGPGSLLGGGPTATTPGAAMPGATVPATPGDGMVTTPGAPVPGQVIPATDPSVNPPADPNQPASGLSDIMTRLLNISAEDTDYLRGEPYSTTQEQAMRAREQDRIRTEYGTARQRLVDQLGAQQGMSGVLAGALDKLGEAEASEMSQVDRDIMIRAADEMRSRLAESRGIVGGLEGLERQRMMESLGLGQSIDESERARLSDLMAAMGLAPNPAQATSAAGNLLNYAGGLSEMASRQGASNLQGIAGLADIFSRLGWMQ